MARRGLVVGNWKMELSQQAALELTRALRSLLARLPRLPEVVICPSFPVLLPVAQELQKTRGVSLGAQNVHWEVRGPWTGEVSVMQIAPLVSWCIVGHSERRALTQETDEQVARKAYLLLDHNITPIVCLGETEEERRLDQTLEKISFQVQSLLPYLNRSLLPKLVIAYEPIWAIGSGNNAEPREASEVALFIRKLFTGAFDQESSERVRILYGGSVTSKNVGSYVTEPGIDGVLVGGASVHAGEFVEIIKQVDQYAGSTA